jgi:hypothetical protein
VTPASHDFIHAASALVTYDAVSANIETIKPQESP